MTDIQATRDGELMVVGIDGETESGLEFVDAFFPKRKDAQCQVVDSGRIILELQDLDAFIAEAKADGLSVEVAEARG